MAKSFSFVRKIAARLPAAKWLWGIGAVVVLGGGYLVLGHRAPTYQLVAVERGSIVETVSLTGNTTPEKDVALAFSNSGVVAHAYVALGQHVSSGQTLAELDTGDLLAQLRQAQANVDTQQAKLDSLRAGSRPEDIAASQAALGKAQQDLANLYLDIDDTLADGYTKADDAVRTQLNGFFSNPESSNPQLNFISSNSQSATDAQTARVSATAALNAWQQDSSGAAASDREAALSRGVARLGVVRDFLNAVSKALDGAVNLSTATLASDKAAVVTAQAEVNTAIKNLNTAAQAIASQKLTVSEAQAQLDLKRAGSTPQDIAAQAAAVEAAQASQQSISAKLQGSRIVAPFAGVVTQMDAKVGQYASPATPVVSLIGTGGYEVDAGVSETDIGKLAVGDAVTMTLDAFPNETFAGKVFYIAPSETNTQGVIDYQIKISFDTPDTRLKSGLTANLTIATRRKDDVLVLPQYAILINDQGTFVQTLSGGKPTSVPVVLGLQDEQGNVEVISGVTDGEQVLNIGLKK